MKRLPSVLLVEDDPLVMEVLVVSLTNLVGRIFQATTGGEALELLDRENFSAVVTDLRIPGPNGLQVIGRARDRQPRARLILISGYADEPVESQVARWGGIMLHKPFGARELFASLGLAGPHALA